MKVLIFFLSFFSIFCFVLSAPTQSADCTNDDEICQNYFETQILPILIRVFICVFIFFVIFIFSIIIFCFLLVDKLELPKEMIYVYLNNIIY